MKKLDLSKKILLNLSAETKVAEGPKRSLVVKITTPTPDRMADIVEPKGMNADNFMKNPIVLFAHNYHDMPIAKCTSLKTADDGVMATVEFPEEGVYPKADTIYQMYKKGFLNAWSIGFMPVGEDSYEENEMGGYTFKSWELLEFSSVPVPANAEALTVMRSKGFDVDSLMEKKEDKKDADNPADPGYTDDTKITELTVGQLKNLIDECMDAEQDEDDEEDKAIEPAIEKAGRTISAKHEALLNECKDMCTKTMDNIKTILSSVAVTDDEDGDKSFKTSSSVLEKLVAGLTLDLKKTDKEVGLALRTLKLFDSGKEVKK